MCPLLIYSIFFSWYFLHDQFSFSQSSVLSDFLKPKHWKLKRGKGTNTLCSPQLELFPKAKNTEWPGWLDGESGELWERGNKRKTKPQNIFLKITKLGRTFFPYN